MAATTGEDGKVLQETINPSSQNLSISQLEDGRLEKNTDDTEVKHPRDGIPTWKWALTCVGLYLGALLYGPSHSTGKNDDRYANINMRMCRPRHNNCS